MTGYKIVNLGMLIEEVGEETVKEILSGFSCPLNKDVEQFLRTKAIDFAKQGWAQTQLVMASYRGEPVLAGYYTLASKYITISSKHLKTKSSSLRRKIGKFARYDANIRCYILTAPLIAQLGKNYSIADGKLISGDELLDLACKKVSSIQYDLGGRYAYVECEDKEKLLSFYSRNGFCAFDIRYLDQDETDVLSGDYLVQMLKYIHQK